MKPRLNFLFLQGEDVGRHLGCYGDTYAFTPNLDRLAAEGTRYTNAFSHSPVCAPSRGGMVTGCYPWTIGNHHMRSRMKNPPRCFTHELRDAGYTVHWPTKLDFNLDPTDGWCTNQDKWWTKPAPDQPFFLYQNFDITHESRMFPEIPDWHPPIPPEAANFPKHDPEKAPVPPYITDCPESRAQVATYYDAFSVIDYQIGLRLKWLDDQGLRDNTVVIFLSDHGRGLPREKRWCYDAGIHLPLIIRWPGQLEAGSVCDDLTAWVDIAPTILSLAGVPVPDHYQGQVFLGEDAAPGRECVFAGRDRMDEVFDQTRAVRDTRWHYIRNDFPGLPWAQWQWYMEQQAIMPVMRDRWTRGELKGDEAVFFADSKPSEELYDADADPHMLNNLASDPAYAGILTRMRSRLEEHQRQWPDLGALDEQALVDQGVVQDWLSGCRQEMSEHPLPPDYCLGPVPPPLTLKDAETYLG